MRTPLIPRSPVVRSERQRGVTIVLVALAMVAIIAMAALSIDVITLYLAKQEAQRSADAAALAAGKVISLSGLTGDPANGTGNWNLICGPDDGMNGLATRVAKAVANQNLIGGAPVTTPTVTYSSGGTTSPTCLALANTGFGVNPIVTVQLQRAGLPTFFSRIWGNPGNTISATATAEVFNPSNSGNSGNTVTGTIVPVQPRCVKPWAVPNQDPWTLAPDSDGFYCNQLNTRTGRQRPACNPLVSLTDGSIQHPGVSLTGNGLNGVVGETLWLSPDCRWTRSTCAGGDMRISTPQANFNNLSGYMRGANPADSPNYPNLVFAPGQVGTPVLAVPSCTSGDEYEQAIEGCDQPQNYSCGMPPDNGGTNAIDLSRNPDQAIANGVACLTHQDPGSAWGTPNGQDYLTPFAAPSAYPFQISAGRSNPLVTSGAGIASGSPISMSSSIVSLPIYDQSTTLGSGTTPVTFVGFLQVFINSVDQFGNVNVTVLNVTGCGSNNDGTPPAVVANSPVPVRLITPP